MEHDQHGSGSWDASERKAVPVPPTRFSPLQPTPTRARTTEKNKGVRQSRTLQSRPVAAEDIGFPFAAQAALLTRQHTGRKNETVGLITDLLPQQLPALQWLKANRQAWGIEKRHPPTPGRHPLMMTAIGFAALTGCGFWACCAGWSSVSLCTGAPARQDLATYPLPISSPPWARTISQKLWPLSPIANPNCENPFMHTRCVTEP